MAEDQKQNRVTDCLVTIVGLVVAVLLAVEFGGNLSDARDGSRKCLSAQSGS